MRRLDPAYRACFADGSTINVRSRPRGDAGGDRPDLRQRGRRRVRGVRRLAARALRRRDAELHRPQLRLPARAAVARRVRSLELLRLGAFGRLGAAVRRRFRDPRLHRLFSFQAMYAGLAPESALALYAVITYMDSIEGVWFPEGGMHAVPMVMAQAAEKAGVTFRYGDAVEEVLRSPTGRVAGCPHGVRGRGSSPTRWSALSTCRPRTSNCSVIFARRERPGAAATRPRRWSGTSASAECRAPRPPTTTSTSATSGVRAFDALLKRGRADARPVAAGHRPVARRPRPGARGCSTLYVLEPVPNLNGDDRLDERGRADA